MPITSYSFYFIFIHAAGLLGFRGSNPLFVSSEMDVSGPSGTPATREACSRSVHASRCHSLAEASSESPAGLPARSPVRQVQVRAVGYESRILMTRMTGMASPDGGADTVWSQKEVLEGSQVVVQYDVVRA